MFQGNPNVDWELQAVRSKGEGKGRSLKPTQPSELCPRELEQKWVSLSSCFAPQSLKQRSHALSRLNCSPRTTDLRAALLPLCPQSHLPTKLNAQQCTTKRGIPSDNAHHRAQLQRVSNDVLHPFLPPECNTQLLDMGPQSFSQLCIPACSLRASAWLCSTNVLCVIPKPSAGTSANVYWDQQAVGQECT